MPYAHAGYGSGGHLAMEYFRMMAKFDAIQVAYRGNAPLVTDLVGGQVKAGFVASAGVMPHVKAGRLRGLATSGDRAFAARARRADDEARRAIPTCG